MDNKDKEIEQLKLKVKELTTFIEDSKCFIGGWTINDDNFPDLPCPMNIGDEIDIIEGNSFHNILLIDKQNISFYVEDFSYCFMETGLKTGGYFTYDGYDIAFKRVFSNKNKPMKIKNIITSVAYSDNVFNYI